MKPYLPVAFLRIVLAVILILTGNQSFLQAQNTDLPGPTPNLMSAPAGTYVIAMDNTLQANPGYFNMKAYGLAVRILNAQRALHWVIRAGKPKDGIDFTANATRVFPASAPASSRDFKAGPLLVLPRDSAGVAAIINAFNNAQPVAERVNVYQLTAPVMVDIRYILTQRPKAVVLNDGNNEKIHSEYYQLAGIDSPLNFSVASAANLISQCYTFASEPHSNTTGPTIGHIKTYVLAGGNFLAQCEAITTYENETNGRFHTTNGIKKENGNPTAAFPNPDLSFSQYEGPFNSQVIGGSVKNWKLETGSSYINNHHKHQSGALPTDSNLVSQSVAKLGTGRGHLVFYTGGHDYSKNTGIDYLNGMRSFFNAFLTPSGLTQCDFLRFDNDLAVTKTGPGNSCVGQTDTFRVVVKNNGPTQTNSAPVVLQDIFPSAGFSIVSASVTSGSFNQATGSWTIGTMANQQSDTLLIIATATTTGSFTNTAYLHQDVHDYNNMNDTARVSVVVSGGDSTFLSKGVGCGTYTLPWGTVVNISGTYTNTLTGVNGCDSVVVIEVQINEVSVTTSTIPVLCYGGATGSVSASPTGGSSPYLYSWSNGGTTATVTDLPAGSYTLTVTDSAGCSETVIAIVTQPSSPVGLSTTQIDVLCNGASTGSIDLTSDGGTGPYNYQWSNGATTEDISGLSAGTYTVTVNDANGSTGGCAATASVIITESPVLIPVAVKTDVSCNGGLTGFIDLDVNGGVSPYNYVWSNGATTEDISNLGAGTYTVTVTDGNGCTANLSETINEPTSPLDLSTTQQNVLCNGASTGDIDLTVTGGTAPYSFIWSNGAVTEDIIALAAGTYTVTVNDANGNSGTCSATATVVITQPMPFLVNPTYTDILCAGGATEVQVFAIGGIPPYAGTGIYTVPAGVHVYELSDANGCTATVSVTVDEPAELTADVQVTGTGCSGGSVTVTANGGTAPYTGTGIFTGLSTGPHTFNVTDANGCTATVTANITAGSSIKITANATAILCHGGQSEVTVTASGGIAPYTGTGKFQVGAGFHTFVVIDAKGCADSVTIVITEPKKLMAFSAVYQTCNGKTASVTVTASGGIGPYTGTGAFTVGSGTYSYTVTDANGCTAVTSVKVTISPPLTVSASATPILCHGGMASVTITATGGTAPYFDTGIFTYPAGTHQLVVKDAKGCTASTTLTITEPATLSAMATYKPDCSGKSGTVTVSATGGTAPYSGTGTFNVGSGTYNFSVTDANGCTAVTTIKVSVAPLLVMTATATPVWCNGGTSQVTVTASGGTPPYSGTGTWVQMAGTYNYVVTDANGCTVDTTLTITEPPALSVAAVYKPDCDGKKGVVTVSATGGTAPYKGTGSFNVGPGTHTYTVTDANGCTATASVKVSTFTPVGASATATPILCHGASSTVTVTATGGTSPYSGTGNFAQLAGTSAYTVMDANGCAATTNVTVTQPDPLVVTATADQGSGDITSFVTGGTAPYAYLWTPGNQTTATINVKISGIYSVQVTDANGCIATATAIQVLNMPCDGFRTQRQMDWGAMPAANNSGAYQQVHFATAFPGPQHLTIGCNHKLRLGSWEAVRDFLPSGNYSGLLPGGLMVDPASNYDNAFAGELVALMLSVRFDELDPGFSTSNYSLADLIIASGTFTGWTVQQVIDEANGKIGGCSSSYSISDLQQTLMAINENYVDGKVNKGFLVCPNAINKSITTPPPAGISATAFPNPFTRSTTIQFGTASDFPAGTALRLEIYSADGRLVAKLFDEPVDGGEVRNVEWLTPGLGEGIYFYHIYGGGKMVTGRIMHANE